MGDPEINARIEAYEMAYRTQARAPELMDFSQESQETLDLYGVKKEDQLRQQLSACPPPSRAGTRFIQLYHGGWDAHNKRKAM